MDELLYSIKRKFFNVDPDCYWGDDFDVRYYLVSKIKKIESKTVLDIGGGIGIISSELEKSNYRINLDLAFEDLNRCKKDNDNQIEAVNGSMINLPFKDSFFDFVICSHLLEIAKLYDIKNNKVIKNNVNQYPTVEKVLEEIYRVLKNNSMLYITTPNNAYYKSTKLTYSELINAITRNFNEYSLYFFNTYPSLSKKHRKLNLSNVVPKIKSKFKNHLEVINSLCKKDKEVNTKSVSFYVEVKK